MAITKETLNEIYRIKVKRGHLYLEYPAFKDCLAEIFRTLYKVELDARRKELTELEE